MTTSLGLRSSLTGPLARPLGHVGGFARMCSLTAKAAFRWPLEWRELILQSWFLLRVTILPTIMAAIPLTVLLTFTLNVLLAEFGAADISGAGAALGAVTQLGPLTTVLVVALRGGQARLTHRPQLAVADLTGQRLIRHRVPEVLEFVAQRADPQMRIIEQACGHVSDEHLEGIHHRAFAHPRGAGAVQIAADGLAVTAGVPGDRRDRPASFA